MKKGKFKLIVHFNGFRNMKISHQNKSNSHKINWQCEILY